MAETTAAEHGEALRYAAIHLGVNGTDLPTNAHAIGFQWADSDPAGNPNVVDAISIHYVGPCPAELQTLESDQPVILSITNNGVNLGCHGTAHAVEYSTGSGGSRLYVPVSPQPESRQVLAAQLWPGPVEES